MSVSVWTWLATLTVLSLIMVADLLGSRGRQSGYTLRTATAWVALSVAATGFFCGGLWVVSGESAAGQFGAAYLTEYSLSADNMFVFTLLMSAFAVPPAYHHRVLGCGMMLAVVLRSAVIAVGAVAIPLFVWSLYPLGGLLLYTALKLLITGDQENEAPNSRLSRVARHVLPVTDDYHGERLFARIRGRVWATPLFVVTVAIGTTDLVFAADSLPAAFGLTREPFLLISANACALMGLRHLYFLISGLLERLTYLSTGLALILGFIGIKLLLEALHETGLPVVAAGRALTVPTVTPTVSVCVIVGTLAATVVASLSRRASQPQASIGISTGTPRLSASSDCSHPATSAATNPDHNVDNRDQKAG